MMILLVKTIEGLNNNSIQAKAQSEISVDLKQFKENVGQDKFNQANEEYNKTIAEKTKKIIEDERYKNHFIKICWKQIDLNAHPRNLWTITEF